MSDIVFQVSNPPIVEILGQGIQGPQGISGQAGQSDCDCNCIGTTGTTIPGQVIQIGGQNGVNLQPLMVDGNNNLCVTVSSTVLWPGTQTIAGVVTVGNLPSTQTVIVSGVVPVSGFPGTQTITGGITTTPTGTQTVSVGFPSTQTVIGVVTTVPSGTQTITGVVFPPTQTIAGGVSVSNLPTTQTVIGGITTTPTGTQTIAGAVSVSNLPTTQTVIGGITTTPTGTQAVSGTFFPGTQTVAPTGTQTVNLAPTTTGLSSYQGWWPANTTPVAVKASPGGVYGYMVFNNASVARWLEFYDVTTVTVGSSASKFTVGIPGGGGANVALPIPVTFSTQIQIAVHAGAGSTDNTAPSANDVILSVWYQ